MSRRQSGAHRDVRIPWRIRLTCWAVGHDHQPIPGGNVHCQRCDRIARTPVEL